MFGKDPWAALKFFPSHRQYDKRISYGLGDVTASEVYRQWTRRQLFPGNTNTFKSRASYGVALEWKPSLSAALRMDFDSVHMAGYDKRFALTDHSWVLSGWQRSCR